MPLSEELATLLLFLVDLKCISENDSAENKYEYENHRHYMG